MLFSENDGAALAKGIAAILTDAKLLREYEHLLDRKSQTPLPAEGGTLGVAAKTEAEAPPPVVVASALKRLDLEGLELNCKRVSR